MGQHAYHPKMLLKVFVYGYSLGIRSSRKLENRLKEDIVFMWLSGRQTPDFRTIADFQKAKLVDVKRVFLEVRGLCQALGMVKIGKVSLNGTTFRADASGNKMRYRKTLIKNKAVLEQRVDDIFVEAERIDREEEKLLGNRTEHTTGIDAKEIQKKLNQMRKRKETLQRNKQKLQARTSDLCQKLRTMRKDRNSMSSTDKDATMMLMKIYAGMFSLLLNTYLSGEESSLYRTIKARRKASKGASRRLITRYCLLLIFDSKSRVAKIIDCLKRVTGLNA